MEGRRRRPRLLPGRGADAASIVFANVESETSRRFGSVSSCSSSLSRHASIAAKSFSQCIAPVPRKRTAFASRRGPRPSTLPRRTPRGPRGPRPTPRSTPPPTHPARSGRSGSIAPSSTGDWRSTRRLRTKHAGERSRRRRDPGDPTAGDGGGRRFGIGEETREKTRGGDRRGRGRGRGRRRRRRRRRRRGDGDGVGGGTAARRRSASASAAVAARAAASAASTAAPPPPRPKALRWNSSSVSQRQRKVRAERRRSRPGWNGRRRRTSQKTASRPSSP